MVSFGLVRYLYVPSSWSAEALQVVVQLFVEGGNDPNKVCRASSVLEAVQQVPAESMLMIPSVAVFDSFEEFLGQLVEVQKFRIVLGSINEPWVNELIRDHAYCVEKLQVVVGWSGVRSI